MIEKGNTRSRGDYYEERAACYLREQGYEILCRNFRCRRGEIDLVARDRKTIVFVEVKYRKSLNTGHPLEAITLAKQKKITMSAVYYLLKEYGRTDVSCRFDVIGVLPDEIVWIKDAFWCQ